MCARVSNGVELSVTVTQKEELCGDGRESISVGMRDTSSLQETLTSLPGINQSINQSISMHVYVVRQEELRTLLLGYISIDSEFLWVDRYATQVDFFVCVFQVYPLGHFIVVRGRNVIGMFPGATSTTASHSLGIDRSHNNVLFKVK